MDIKQSIQHYFDHFHAHPEVSFKEFETTKKLAEIMDELGVSYRTFDDVTGLIAEIGQGERVVAMRADIDALWQEVDGVERANHSCGHDAHMAMVLGALLHLKDEPLDKRVRFIFQPAEETGNGSLDMVRHGALEDVTHLYGIHLRAQDELSFGRATSALHHGSSHFLKGRVIGEDAHGARPQQGKNAIDVLMSIQQAIKSIYFSPFESYSAKMTNIRAGGESLNIIPGRATFALDVRAQSNSLMDALKLRITGAIAAIESLHGVVIEWEWDDYTPGAEVSEEARDIAAAAIKEVLGAENTAQPIHTPGADDFHFYTIKKPELKATMIGLGAGLTPGLHHPDMRFNHDVLEIGAEILAATVKKS